MENEEACGGLSKGQGQAGPDHTGSKLQAHSNIGEVYQVLDGTDVTHLCPNNTTPRCKVEKRRELKARSRKTESLGQPRLRAIL